LLTLLLFALCLPISGCGVSDFDDCFDCYDDYYDDCYTCFGDDLLAVDDLYETDADTTIFVGAVDGVLINDVFFDPSIEFPETSVRGGVVDGNGDGSFTYTPPPAFAGTDSFEYTLYEGFDESTATVTIIINATVTPNPGFFVDSATGNDATANPATGAPFATLGAALAQAGVNAEIVVRPGTGQPYAGNVALANGQSLLGQGFENVAPQGQTRPVLSGSVSLANGNLIRGLAFANTNGDAIRGDGRQGATISDCSFETSSNGGRAISGDGARGSWVIVGNTISGMDDAGIRLSSSGNASLSVLVQDNTISNCQLSAISFQSQDSSSFTASVKDNAMNGNDPGFTFDILATDGSTFRLDLENNANDDVYLLSTLEFTGTFEVENLSSLQTRNLSGTVVLDQDAGSNPITEVGNGSIGL
jgi:hypothetical protein